MSDGVARAACSAKHCVQVSRDGDEVLVGDTKNPAGEPLRFTLAEMSAFLAGAKAGEFDDLVAGQGG